MYAAPTVAGAFKPTYSAPALSPNLNSFSASINKAVAAVQVKFASPAKAPESLNCTCVVDPAAPVAAPKPTS